MIASLSGVVKSIQVTTIVIEVGGVGLLVQVSPRITTSLHVGKMASLHTALLVREDSLTLYGFDSAQDRALFDLLQTVSGIGPKVAQSALNIYESTELEFLISSGDAGSLEKIPGLGKKGAQRLILELKEKVGTGSQPSSLQSMKWSEQLQDALTGLGFNAKDVLQIVETVSIEFPKASDESIETLLKYALHIKGRRS